MAERRRKLIRAGIDLKQFFDGVFTQLGRQGRFTHEVVIDGDAIFIKCDFQTRNVGDIRRVMALDIGLTEERLKTGESTYDRAARWVRRQREMIGA